MTPTRPILEVSPVFWLCCWSLLYSCIYLLSSPHWLGCWIWFLSASDWNRSSRKLPTQSCGLWYWPHTAIKAASLGCGCHQRQMRWPVSGGGFEEALVPVSCVLLPSPLHSTNYLPAPRWSVLGLCLIVISCCCLSAAAGLSLSFTQSDFMQFGFYFSVWAGWIWTTGWFLTWHVSGASPAKDHWPHPALSVHLTCALASVLCS